MSPRIADTTTGPDSKENTTMRTKKITIGSLAAVAAAGLALSGCSMLGGESEKTALEVDGEYVYAPAASSGAEPTGEESEELPDDSGLPAEDEAPSGADDVGDLYTMTIAGTEITVTRQSCEVGADGSSAPATDARETAFGQLAEPAEDGTAAITWVEGGALTEDAELPLAVVSDGAIVRVGDNNFFVADSEQGQALTDQFTSGCGTEAADADTTTPGAPEDETEAPDDTASDTGSASGEGKVYAQSIQAFSPFLEKWTVDGKSVVFEKLNCLGESEKTTGTWEGNKITWDGSNPMVGAGTGLTTQMEPLTDNSLHRVGASGSAVPDFDGQLDAHIEKCTEAGETLGGILLGR